MTPNLFSQNRLSVLHKLRYDNPHCERLSKFYTSLQAISYGTGMVTDTRSKYFVKGFGSNVFTLIDFHEVLLTVDELGEVAIHCNRNHIVNAAMQNIRSETELWFSKFCLRLKILYCIAFYTKLVTVDDSKVSFSLYPLWYGTRSEKKVWAEVFVSDWLP